MPNLYGFEVKHATVNEIDAIAEITRAAFLKYCEAARISTDIEALNETFDDIRRDIENKEVYVAFIDNVPVGSVRIEILDGGLAHLSRFGVREDQRNNGIGKILMNVVDNRMKLHNVKRLELHTASWALPLVRFYYGRGFYVESVENSRGYPRALMVKEYK